MFKATIQADGNLRLTACNETRQFIKENQAHGYWQTIAELFEYYSCNGSFVHFDAGDANPFVGLTSAPCIAEYMSTSDSGKNEIYGRLWYFGRYVVDSDLDELKNRGYTVYQLAS